MKAVAVVLLIWTTSFLGADALTDAQAALARQEWQSAVNLLSAFLLDHGEDPQAPTAAFLRAVALYQMGDHRASLDGFQKLERTWPQSPLVKRLPYWKGTAALGAGQFALAERELTLQARYPQEEPFTTRALLNLALARIAQGKSATEALGAFTKASTEARLLSQAWALWADEDRRASRIDGALAKYQRAWEAFPGGPWDLTSRLQAVDLLVSAQRWSQAQELLEASSLRMPDPRWHERRTSVLRGLGDRQALALNLEQRWVATSDPATKQALAANRARVAEELGQPEALWWERAALGPDEALGLGAVTRQAFLLESTDRHPEAAQALEAWATAHPGSALREAAWSRAAQDWLLVGKGSAARGVWGRLLETFPGSKDVPAWLLARGRSFLEAGDTTKALIDFTVLLKDHPKAYEAPEARYQTGLVYLDRQEPARAEAWFYPLTEELRTGDLYERALLARGVSFVNAGKTDLARGSLQRLIREAPRSPWVGAAWGALGRNALQVRAFAEASAAFAEAETVLSDPAARARALWDRIDALVGLGDLEAADEALVRYTNEYPEQPRVSEALVRRGALWSTAQNWSRALEVWSTAVGRLGGASLAQAREGMAQAELRAGRPQEGWDQLLVLETTAPSPEAWYRWGQAALTLGRGDWALKAFEWVLQNHPQSAVAEAALPRAAGALLGGGRSDLALERYADYFRKWGTQPAAAPVARTAAAAAQPYPQNLAALVAASKTWGLAPEVATEFVLAWAQSRLDTDPLARQELEDLGRQAPWASQRSDALTILGRWHLASGRLTEARTFLEVAATLGDDLSVFRARWALAQVTEKEGDPSASARQRESAEKVAGPGVPLEFRLQVLGDAADAWERAGRAEEAQRVRARVDALRPRS